mgnify:CR=1 FL=1
MNFRTIVDISAASWQIAYKDKIALLGSCFSDNIAHKMEEYYFQVICNPTGTLYNPVSVAHHIDDVAPMADVIIVTFGTAWVYVDKATNEVVDNCCKRPASDFIRRRLRIEEIIALWQPIVEKYADKRFIFTISPIRHIKDGLHENNLSKSVLQLAVERLVNISYDSVLQKPLYFPAYEIVMDELRDYRFYADDMLHPSAVTVSYIWQQFVQVFVSTATQQEMDKLHSLWLNRNHRSLHPGSAEDSAFKKRTEQQFRALKDVYPWLT